MPDLERLRDDFAFFCAAIGSKLTSVQIAAFQTEKDMLAVLAPRGWGKTDALATYGVWRALSRAGHAVIFAANDEVGGRRLLQRAQAIATGSPLLRGSVVDEYRAVMTLRNGSVLRAVTNTSAALRGHHGDLIADEAQAWSEEVLVSAGYPIASVQGSKIVLAGTASQADGPFYNACRAGQAGSESLHYTRGRIEDAMGWTSASWLKAMEESMSPTRYAAEILCEWASGDDLLFPKAAVDRVTYHGQLGSLETVLPPARIVAGVDWGAYRDRSAFVGLARNPMTNDDPTFVVCIAKQWEAGYPLHRVIDEIVKTKAHVGYLTPESNGIGLPLVQDLARKWKDRDDFDGGAARRSGTRIIDDTYAARNVHTWWAHMHPKRPEPSAWAPGPQPWTTRISPHHTSQASKSAMFSALRLLVDREQLLIPQAATELLRELMLVRIDLTATGERIEASSGHDDLALALAFSLTPHKRNDRWTTLIERAADARRPQPKSQEIALRSTTTLGGRVVPSGMSYQSVAGDSLTIDEEQLAPNTQRLGDWLIKR